MTRPIIEIAGLDCRFPDGTRALDDVSVTFRAGEFTVIAGANGSGKTTLLRHVNGLLRPRAGSVTVLGTPVAEDPQRVRRLVGLIFQEADSQIVGETVASDTAFGPENLGLDRAEIRERVAAALADVDLADRADKSPHLLSGGEKRRLAIAGVLAMRPRVLLMDEPFSNLDYPVSRLVLSQLLALHRAGHTIIVTTHDLEKVIGHADRLIVMERGRLVADGAPEDVIEHVERYGIRPPCSVRYGRGIEPWPG